MPALWKIILDWILLIPHSIFGHLAFDLPWFDRDTGTRHLVFDPLAHPKPRLYRWLEHIVQLWMSFGQEKRAERQRIKSTSSLGSEKENRDL